MRSNRAPQRQAASSLHILSRPDLSPRRLGMTTQTLMALPPSLADPKESQQLHLRLPWALFLEVLSRQQTAPLGVLPHLEVGAQSSHVCHPAFAPRTSVESPAVYGRLSASPRRLLRIARCTPPLLLLLEVSQLCACRPLRFCTSCPPLLEALVPLQPKRTRIPAASPQWT